jgi:hypothetical protein
MDFAIISSALATVIAALLGAFIPAGRELIPLLIRKGIGRRFFNEHPLGKEIVKAFGIERSTDGPEQMFEALSSASQKMDVIVKQIQNYTEGREQAVAELESHLGLLSQQEQEMKQRIQGLRNVPLPAAEYFAQLVNKSEKRSAYRDYVLFLLGVLVTAGVGVLLRKLGWA